MVLASYSVFDRIHASARVSEILEGLSGSFPDGMDGAISSQSISSSQTKLHQLFVKTCVEHALYIV